MPTPGRKPRPRPNTPFVTLAALRRAIGVTQEDMATRLGLTRDALSTYETGSRRIPSHLLVPLTRAYGIEPGDIHWGLPGEQ